MTGARNTAAATSPVTVLDNRRTPCAIGLIRAEAIAAALPAGSTLEILTRDRFAVVEIPLWAARSGHSTPRISRSGRWPRRYAVYSVITADTVPTRNA